jgi:hypothetical protein
VKTPPRVIALPVIFSVGAVCGWTFRPVVNHTSESRVIFIPAKENTITAETSGAAESPRTDNDQAKDFAARLSRIRSTGNQFKRARMIAAIADDLDAAQVSAALDSLVGSGSLIGAEELFTRWGELDPAAALSRVLTFPMERVLSMQAVVRGWAGKDAKAVEVWLAESNSPLKEAARRGLVAAVADTDPERAFALLQGLSQWNDYPLAEAVFARWSESQPATSAAHAAQLPSGYFRDDALNLVARQWASWDGASAVAWAETLPETAMDRRTIPFPANALTTAVKTWMDADAGAATSWLDQISDEKQKNQLLGSLIAMTGDEDPRRAEQLLAALLPSGEEHDKALKDLAARWSRRDSHGALEWAQQQTDAHVREMIVPDLAEQLPNSENLDPQDTQAALQLAQSLTGNAQQRATGDVLNAWTTNDPVAAAAWATQYPDNADYLSAVAISWMVKDADAATEWVTSLPSGPARDQVLSLPVESVFAIAPEIAVRWIAEMSDPQKRESAYKVFAAGWLESDVKAARAWIATSPLPDVVKTQLLNTDAR